MRPRTRFAITVIAAVTLVCCALYAGHPQLLPCFAGWLDVGTAPQPVDYVLALPGGAERRPFVAAALINSGFAKQALILRNGPSPDVEDGIVPPTWEITKRIYLVRGILEEKIVVLGGQSVNTFSDMEILADFLDKHPHARVAIVTSAYHTRRARWSFSRQLGNKMQRVSIVSSPNPDFVAEEWWKTETGLLGILTEYAKLLAYWVLYGTGLYWMAGGFLAAVAIVVRRRRKRLKAEAAAA